MPAVTRRQPDPRRQAGRDGAADRHRPTTRQDQVVLAYQRYGRGKALALADPGFVDVEDGREDAGRGHDARDVLAAAGALAGRRRARSGRR